jgi:outer membrane protein OmpA-like peptidoglycan-associated protein
MYCRVLLIALSFCLLALFVSQPAAAQSTGFSINRFDVSERGSDWFVGESLDLRGHGRGALGLVADYAYKPLVFYDLNGDEQAVVVSHQLFIHLGGSVILWDRLRLAANVPIAARTDGNRVRVGTDTIEPETGTDLGDIRLGADVRLVGSYGGPAQLALGAQIYLPTGSRGAFVGDGGVRVMPRLMLAGDLGPFAYSVRAALSYRSQKEALAGVPVGSEVFFAATSGIWFADRKLLLGPELSGSTVIEGDGAFKRATTPFELLFGLHFRPTDWRFGLGAGPGLTRGLGAPQVRLLATVEWSPSVPEAPKDRDRDGVFDPDDACPDLPGPRSSNPKENGCPIADRDRDGILDDVDACPDLYGAPSDDPKRNGCPPAGDRDGDGIFDDEDACPDQAGLKSDDPEKNGCPGDTDGDGILDPDDACPRVPGPRDPDPLKNGCPKARIEQGQIKILERVEFATDSARILPVSDGLLTAVSEIIRDHRELKRISVEGHTDNVGGAAYNKGLSERRAASVVSWLIAHGVESSRLTSQGFGLEKPLDTNDTAAGRQRNRRVEFHILETRAE